MKALNLTKKNYVLKEEKGSGSPTTFVIKGLNGLQMLELSNAETDHECQPWDSALRGDV